MKHHEVVAELKRIKSVLPRKSGDYNWHKNSSYICNNTNSREIIFLINSRLKGNSLCSAIVEGYVLNLNPTPPQTPSIYDDIQAFRHAWLDELILEFSAHPDKEFDPFDNSNAHPYPGVPYV